MKILLFLLIPVFCFGQLLTEIDNQILHLKGTTGVTVTGSGVSTWADQSGNSNNFTQGTDADRPNYVSSSYLDFDHANTELLTRADDNDFSFGNGTTDSPFSMVAYINLDDATKFRILSKSDAVATTEYFFTSSATDYLGIFMYKVGDVNNSISRTILATSYEGSWITVGFSYDASGDTSGIKLYIDGVNVKGTAAKAGTYTAMSNTASSIRMASLAWTPDYSNGKIGDVLVTSDVLTPTEMANIHTYFTTGTYPSEEDQPGFPKYKIYPNNKVFK